MPSSSGPNTVNDSIVFNYDTGDVANSYKGEPTTNLASGGDLIGMSGISLSYIGLEDGWKKYSMSGTFTGGGYPYIMYLQPVSFTGGQYYSTQAIVKTNVPYKFNYFGSSGVSYVNEPKINEGTLTQTTLPDGSSYVTRFGFAYTNTTSQPGYLFTNPINNTTFNASTDFVYLKNFQVEQKDHCTQFTPTSRSSTQGLLDLSGRGVIATLSNSYTSNAQITFDGIDDNIGMGNLGSINDFTVEIIFKSDSVSNYRNPIDCNWLVFNNGNSGYSNIGPRLEQNSSGNLAWVIGRADGNYTGLSIVSSGLNGSSHHYAAITKNATYFSGYYNGVNTVNTYYNDWYGAFSNVTVGRGFSASSERWFIGQIPMVKIYNRALGASEIANNYNELRTRFKF